MSEWGAERVQSFKTTVFAEYTALANAHDAINLGQGFPNFPAPEFVLSAAQAALAAGHHQYSSYSGEAGLVNALAQQAELDLGRAIDPRSCVQITSGATASLYAACQALLNPGDEAILFEPYYDAYPADVTMAGGIPRFVPLHPQPGGDWIYDRDELAAAFSPSTRLLFLNTPHNPTGKIFHEQELIEIAELCLRHDVIVLADEVYERLIFDDLSFTRVANVPGMWDRTVSIGSAGKTFSVTGWKVGWSIGPAHLINPIRNATQWITFCVATPLQVAVAGVIAEARTGTYYQHISRDLQKKRDTLLAILRSVNLTPYIPQSTYFILADFSDYPFASDDQFCRWLTSEIGVAAIPNSSFYCPEHRHGAPPLARFAFCKTEDTLQQAAARLAQIR